MTFVRPSFCDFEVHLTKLMRPHNSMIVQYMVTNLCCVVELVVALVIMSELHGKRLGPTCMEGKRGMTCKVKTKLSRSEKSPAQKSLALWLGNDRVRPVQYNKFGVSSRDGQYRFEDGENKAPLSFFAFASTAHAIALFKPMADADPDAEIEVTSIVVEYKRIFLSTDAI
ncbi:unnamed protein product [Peronospora belbahrii]|uniref:Uncharacterized protein n=1 Tax=Peronospora belbahrii TaxID=622444 RepID=A0ABN8CU93_9STRA|nr:unnamed protein product [Peronospora belbahrii]